MDCRDWATWVALSAFPDVSKRTAWCISAGESLEGRPPEDLGICGQCLDQTQLMVAVENPVWAAIQWTECLQLMRWMMFSVWAGDKACMIDLGGFNTWHYAYLCIYIVYLFVCACHIVYKQSHMMVYLT